MCQNVQQTYHTSEHWSITPCTKHQQLHSTYSFKCYKFSTLQKLLYVTACDISIAIFFLHLMTSKSTKYKNVFTQVRSTADYKKAGLNDS